MYEARQNKEKVSRRIDGRGEIQYTKKYEDKRNDLLSKNIQRNGFDIYTDTNIQCCSIIQKESEYLEKLRTTNMWGGEPEAHAIATSLGFSTRIYYNSSTSENNSTQIGSGVATTYNLRLIDNHYVVINQNNNVVYDPPADGNCLFMALAFLYFQTLDSLNFHEFKPSIAGKFREIAADWLEINSPELVNILEDEYQKERKRLEKYPGCKNINIQTSKKLKTILGIQKKYPPQSYFFEKEFQHLKSTQNDKTIKLANIYIKKDDSIDDNFIKYCEVIYCTSYSECIANKDPSGNKEAIEFHKKYPNAVWIPPSAIQKKCIRKTDFERVHPFITTAFNGSNSNLSFKGHGVYHGTRGGNNDTTTVFGIVINENKFLIAIGSHVTNTSYKITWSCEKDDPLWGKGKIVSFAQEKPQNKPSSKKQGYEKAHKKKK